MKELVNFINESIKSFANGFNGCYYFSLGNINNDEYYYVIGWGNGFEPRENDILSDGNYHVCGKIAYNNNILQCDYEWDWYMPQYNDDGDIWDTDCELNAKCDIKELARWILNEFKEMQRELVED